jgi:calcyphosin
MIRQDYELTLSLPLDQDDSGSISLDEFLYGIRGTLSPRRRSFVERAFKLLDKDRSGVIDYEDVKGTYDASRHPEVIAGRKTVLEVLNDFLGNFEKDSVRTKAGEPIQITWQEFERYYANISASIDDDDYFELMMRNSWHISGGEGWCANTSNRRVLVTHNDGRQSVQEIQNDLGIGENDTDEMMRRLGLQGVQNIAKLDRRGGVDSDDAKPQVRKPKSLEAHILHDRNTSSRSYSSNQDEAPPSNYTPGRYRNR